MPVTVARTAPRRTVRCATARHDGGCMPPHAPGCAVPRHVPSGEAPERRVAGELERSLEGAILPGKWLAAGVVFLCLIACQLSGLAGAFGAPRRASLVMPGFGLPDKLLLSRARSSVSLYFVPGWPYMGSVVPASSSCRGLVFLARQAPLAGGLVLNAWSSLGASWAGLAAGCYNCPCTSLGY